MELHVYTCVYVEKDFIDVYIYIYIYTQVYIIIYIYMGREKERNMYRLYACSFASGWFRRRQTGTHV